MDDITPIILYLQECMYNITLSTFILVIPYNADESLLYMLSVLNHIQYLTAHPTAMLVPDIKAAIVIFHQLFPLIPL